MPYHIPKLTEKTMQGPGLISGIMWSLDAELGIVLEHHSVTPKTRSNQTKAKQRLKR